MNDPEAKSIKNIFIMIDELIRWQSNASGVLIVCTIRLECVPLNNCFDWLFLLRRLIVEIPVGEVLAEAVSKQFLKVSCL